MNGLTVVVTMAGRGQRFADAGFARPKPLIDVLGRPMYSWALDGVPLEVGSRLVFVGLADHVNGFSLRTDIQDRYGQYQPTVIALEDVTDGQICTVLAARAEIDPDAGLLIFNCDTWFRSSLARRLTCLEDGCDGLIGAFEAAGDHWSFVRVDAAGQVLETAEKRRISKWATTGLYHFSRASDFVRHAEAMVKEGDTTRGEYYVAPLYNRLIADGADIRLDIADEVRPLGTPAELEEFVRWRIRT